MPELYLMTMSDLFLSFVDNISLHIIFEFLEHRNFTHSLTKRLQLLGTTSPRYPAEGFTPGPKCKSHGILMFISLSGPSLNKTFALNRRDANNIKCPERTEISLDREHESLEHVWMRLSKFVLCIVHCESVTLQLCAKIPFQLRLTSFCCSSLVQKQMGPLVIIWRVIFKICDAMDWALKPSTGAHTWIYTSNFPLWPLMTCSN